MLYPRACIVGSAWFWKCISWPVCGCNWIFVSIILPDEAGPAPPNLNDYAPPYLLVVKAFANYFVLKGCDDFACCHWETYFYCPLTFDLSPLYKSSVCKAYSSSKQSSSWSCLRCNGELLREGTCVKLRVFGCTKTLVTWPCLEWSCTTCMLPVAAPCLLG